jgi:Protein of unknown function (DUF2782)
MKRLLLPALLLCSFAAAEEPVSLPPPPPPGLGDQEDIEPEVRIIKGEDQTIEEYRVNGQLYMIKVTPKNAPTYYLVDSDGDGSLESSPSEIEPRLMIPSWVLFRW